jgi:hypothetical protein
VCSQLLEAASIFEVCDLSCTEFLERLERVERAGPSSDLVEYFHTFGDVIGLIFREGEGIGAEDSFLILEN